MRRWLAALLPIVAFGCQSAPPGDAGSSAPQLKPANPSVSASVMERAGVPVYPGAKQLGIASGKPDSTGGDHFNALYSSADPPAKVGAFYKDQLKFDALNKGASVMLVGKTKTGSDLLIFIDPDGTGSKLSIKGILYKNDQGKG